MGGQAGFSGRFGMPGNVRQRAAFDGTGQRLGD